MDEIPSDINSLIGLFRSNHMSIEEIVEQCPASSLARLVLLKKHIDNGGHELQPLAEHTALYAGNIQWYKYLLSKLVDRNAEEPEETDLADDSFNKPSEEPAEKQADKNATEISEPLLSGHASGDAPQENIRMAFDYNGSGKEDKEESKEETIEQSIEHNATSEEGYGMESHTESGNEIPGQSPENEKVNEPVVINDGEGDIDAEGNDESVANLEAANNEEKTDAIINDRQGDISVPETTEKFTDIPVDTDDPKKPEEQIKDEDQPDKTEGPLAFEPLHTVDYFASQGIRLRAEDLSDDKLSQQVKSFTGWLKSMKKLHPGKLPDQEEAIQQIIQSAAEVSNTETDVLTEAMAEVLVKQNKKEKAIEMYQKLSLMNPSKSAYFAAKIQSLKTL